MDTVGTLAGGIAHDLNNQMTPLSGYLDMLMMELGPKHALSPMLREASDAAKRCFDTIARLTRFSRPSTQKKEIVAAHDLLEEVRSMIMKFIPSTISLEVACAPETWPILCNEGDMQSVFMSLAVNASEAMPRGGSMRIEAANLTLNPDEKAGCMEGPYVRFRIEDTGGGIPDNVIAKIFEPFFSTKPRGRSSGLGLAMTFAIVRSHGGAIEASNRAGGGACFEIHIPAKPQARPHASPDSTAVDSLPRGSETILIADDEEPLRTLAVTLLEKLGYRPLAAKDGEEAVAVYKKRSSEIGASSST
jgi:signal transduction histidine kinase